MQNALSATGGPPPAPNPTPQDTQPASPLAMGGPPTASAAPPGAQQPQIPPPSHQQTIAALRHFSAVERELQTLMTDPDLGKADMRSKIIDGASSLVSKGILGAAQAVAQLGTVPDRPFEQKEWLLRNFAQVVQAQTAVIAHYQAGAQNTPIPTEPINPDNHLSDMSGLRSQYQGGANG